MADLKLLGMSGSLRKDSVNTKLVREAARLFGEADFVMGDLNLPLYNGDDEDTHGIPTVVQNLSDQIAAADAVIVSTPEYNQSMSGVIKNALDWISRTKGGPWRGKPVALMAAAAGRAGGARGAYALRLAMSPFHPLIVAAPEVLIANAGEAYDDGGRLTDDRGLKTLTDAMEALRAVAEAHATARGAGEPMPWIQRH